MIIKFIPSPGITSRYFVYLQKIKMERSRLKRKFNEFNYVEDEYNFILIVSGI